MKHDTGELSRLTRPRDGLWTMINNNDNNYINIRYFGDGRLSFHIVAVGTRPKYIRITTNDGLELIMGGGAV